MRASSPRAPRKEGRARGGETRARRPRLPQNLLSAGVLAIALSTLSVSSCSGDSAFLRTNPFLPARPLYWHRAACSSLLWSLYFCGVSCNLLVSFPVLLIWALSVFFPRWVWLKVYQFCLSFLKKQLVVSDLRYCLPCCYCPRILVPLVFISTVFHF